MLPPIIAFTGAMGSGKSTCAEICRSIIPNSKIIKFAGPIYALQNIVYSALELPPPNKDRELLQTLGTWGRNKSESFWVDQWERHFKEARSHQTIVLCDDLRFDNEAAKIKALGGKIIRVEASREERSKRIELINEKDISEKGISDHYVDFILTNENVSNADLKHQISKIVSQCHGGFNGN